MTTKELAGMSFEEAITKLCEERNTITTLETLKAYAQSEIDNERYFVAIHILKALQSADDGVQYFDYDYCMGTLEMPTQIKTKEDLEDYCDDTED